MIREDVAEGKYTVVFSDDGRLYALRYGEPWRDLVGDGLMLSMLQEIEKLKIEIDDLVLQAVKNETGFD